MLLYHPAFDIYHCIFRMLRILEHLPRNPVEVDRLRILDFYLLFPNELEQFTFPADYKTYRKRLAISANPYSHISDPKRIFFRLEPYQMCALRSLVAHGFIDGEAFLQEKIIRTDKPLPKALGDAVKSSTHSGVAVLEFLTGPLFKMDFYGKSGLKGRSDLFEYRYDLANSTTRA